MGIEPTLTGYWGDQTRSPAALPLSYCRTGDQPARDASAASRSSYQNLAVRANEIRIVRIGGCGRRFQTKRN